MRLSEVCYYLPELELWEGMRTQKKVSSPRYLLHSVVVTKPSFLLQFLNAQSTTKHFW